LDKNTLQQIVKQADELDEEPGGHHHYRQMDHTAALKQIQKLDQLIDRAQYPIRSSV
ncbi:phosphohydrolase, partial [Bacillus velezensis]